METVALENNYEKFTLSDGTLILCNFIDTGGALRLRATNEPHYRKVDGFIVIFDITNQKTFDDVRDYFIPKIQEYNGKDIPVLIIGHKKDMKHLREVSMDEAYDLAFKNNYSYKETSCIENYNLNDVFEEIIESTKHFIKGVHYPFMTASTFHFPYR